MNGGVFWKFRARSNYATTKLRVYTASDSAFRRCTATTCYLEHRTGSNVLNDIKRFTIDNVYRRQFSIDSTKGNKTVEEMLLLGIDHFDRYGMEVEEGSDSAGNASSTNLLEAEKWLHKAAEATEWDKSKLGEYSSTIKAKYMLGVLLTSTNDVQRLKENPLSPNPDDLTATISGKDAAEAVRRDILKIKKEAMVVYKSKAASKASTAAVEASLSVPVHGNKQDFEGAYRKRKLRIKRKDPNEAKSSTVSMEPSNINNFAPLQSKHNIQQGSRRDRGLNHLRGAASVGHRAAMILIANLLFQELTSPEKYDSQAHHEGMVDEMISWYKRALEDRKVAAVASSGNCDAPDGIDSSNVLSIDHHVRGGPMKEAAYNLGMLFHEGIRALGPDSHASPQYLLPIDPSKSMEYFELAANLGEPSAALWCGVCYMNFLFDGDLPMPQSVEKAFASATKPSSNRNTFLSDKLLHYFHAAAAADETSARAHFHLSQYYKHEAITTESGTETDTGTAELNYLKHLRLAAKAGDAEATHTVADLHMQIFQASLTTNEQHLDTADSSDPLENTNELPSKQLYDFLCQDLELPLQSSRVAPSPPSVQQHLAHAVRLYQLASVAGHADSSLRLGVLYYQGLLNVDVADESGTNAASSTEQNNFSQVQANKRRAFELYGLAGEQGSLEAWRNIAAMHMLGDGIPRCEKTAREIMRVMFPN